MSTAKHLVYVGVGGTNVHTELGHGRVTFIRRTLGVDAAVVIRLDDGRMTYATLGAASGDRNEWREIESIREITRDEFDDITGLAEIRREMGWRP